MGGPGPHRVFKMELLFFQCIVLYSLGIFFYPHMHLFALIKTAVYLFFFYHCHKILQHVLCSQFHFFTALNNSMTSANSLQWILQLPSDYADNHIYTVKTDVFLPQLLIDY